jgi:septum formation protein
MKKQNAGFILASASPQRRRLLTQMGIEADVRPVDLEEDHELGDDAADLVRILALDKLRARLEYPIEGEDGLLAHRPESLILAADTIVALDEHRLGKPRDRDQARKFLEKLSGRTHEVLTALALYLPFTINPDTRAMAGGGVPAFSLRDEEDRSSGPVPALPEPYSGKGLVVLSTAVTHISIMELTALEIEAYLGWQEWQGAAGGYRVQGRAGCFLEEMTGSYTNVVGLPIEALYGILRRTSFWSGV